MRASREYVFSGSTDQRIWLDGGVSAVDAIAILSDVLTYCDIDFDVLIIERPQLWIDEKSGQHQFSAPKCNYEYSFLRGQPIRGAAFRLDTEDQNLVRSCDLLRLGQYMDEVTNQLRSNWKVPDTDRGISCSVSIGQDTNGEITGFEFVHCAHSTEVQNSVENAIYDTGKLPLDSAGICFFDVVRVEFNDPGPAQR